MPIVQFRHVDVFAFVDADTDEARAFTTYAGYVGAFNDLITDAYGVSDPYPAIATALDRNGRLTRLRNKPYRGEARPVQSLLINGWLSELHLHLVDGNDAGVVRVANHAAGVHAYYATTRAASAWLHVLNGTVPTNHAGCLDQIGQLVAKGAALYPHPWTLACTATRPGPSYAGFSTPPQACSNLSTAAPPADRLAMCLRTTRERHVAELVAETRRQLRRTRAPSGEAARRDRGLRPTTPFDFLWRIRTRSNYGDPAVFYMGALTDAQVLGYLLAIKVITATTMFLFEAMVAHRAPDVFAGAADHFIARDRSGRTDQVLVPRLAALGFARNPRRAAG
ncbi:MAG: hypothetical protein M3Q48_06060 [Actinomycetota bacterium]|nr:hypothetical protein [Actinomycetota bacterium]